VKHARTAARVGRSLGAVVTLIALLLTLTGCTSRPVRGMPEQYKFIDPAAARVLLSKHNANLAGLDRLWARSIVEIQWRTADKKERFEQGDGNVVMVLPNKLALSVGKLGNTLLWAGGDAERYWLFDLKGDGLAYVGAHRNVSKPRADDAPTLPLPVQPADLIRLLGVMPLPDAVAGESAKVMEHEEYVVFMPDSRTKAYVDSSSALPRKIELLDGNGNVVVTGLLSEPIRVELAGKPPGAWPTINSKLVVTVAGRSGRLSLHLSDVSDGREEERIQDRVFDFGKLKALLKPTVMVDLDAGLSRSTSE
jgi:hypothetical protein